VPAAWPRAIDRTTGGQQLQITIQLTEEAARALHQGQAIPALRQIIDQLGIDIQPLHPGSRDWALMSFFAVEVPDTASAERVIAALLRSPYVAAAYIKPPDAPPA
jgi:hypothetical protein